MDFLGLGMGLRAELAHTERTREASMDAIENIALMVLLMLAGVGIAAVVLCGFIYYMEVQDDR
jgi:C4-dicarboxylate transporter